MEFSIEGMDCADEVAALRSALASLAGGDDLHFDLLRGRLTVRQPATGGASVSEIQRLVRETGMTATPWDGASGVSRSAPALATSRHVACGFAWGLTAVGYALHGTQHGYLHALGGEETASGLPLLSRAVLAVATISGAWFVIPKAWAALRSMRADMNLLMTVAITGAMLIGEWFEAAVVSSLFALALVLESWSVERARRAIEALLDLSPATARVREGGGTEWQEVPVEEVAPGTVLSVLPGERIPLDGFVTHGHGSVDESPVTGESMPRVKEQGDAVFAGTINAEAALEIRSTRPADDSTLAHIVRAVEEAQDRKAPSEQWVERFARRYTPLMMILALATGIVPPLLGLTGWSASIYSALVLLVIACPCALVISTPVTVVAALAASARAGVLVKGGSYLEVAAQLRGLAVDKTGTLTRGEPTVQRIATFDSHDAREVLAWAGALEAKSTHPLAQAIVAHATQQGASPSPAETLRELPGRGAEGTLDGRRLWIGGHRLTNERGAVTPEVHAVLESFEEEGLTPVALGEGDHVCGVFGLADEIRPEAGQVLGRLSRAGIARVLMLTGDHAAAAGRVARTTGVTEWRAGLLPDEKVRCVEELRDEVGRTAMLGDGVNDAPALAVADLGIAMGAAGSDVAIETADVALMSDDLTRLPWFLEHAQRALRTIRQNVGLALGTKAIVMVLALTGLSSLWLAIAADMGTSLLVIANALRLLRPR